MKSASEASQESNLTGVANGIGAGIRSQGELEPRHHRQSRELSEGGIRDHAALQPPDLRMRHTRRTARDPLAQPSIATRIT
jgi:hypothetical protein